MEQFYNLKDGDEFVFEHEFSNLEILEANGSNLVPFVGIYRKTSINSYVLIDTLWDSKPSRYGLPKCHGVCYAGCFIRKI